MEPEAGSGSATPTARRDMLRRMEALEAERAHLRDHLSRRPVDWPTQLARVEGELETVRRDLAKPLEQMTGEAEDDDDDARLRRALDASVEDMAHDDEEEQ